MAPDLNNGIKLFYVDEATGTNQVAMQVLNSNGVKQLPGIGTLVTAYGHAVYGNVPVSNNHAILMLSGGFAKYVPLGSGGHLTANTIATISQTKIAASISIYPNPATTQAVIQFQLKKSSHTSIIVYDINGKAIRTILNENLDAGIHLQPINISGLIKGTYFIKLSTDEGIQSEKLIIE